MNNKYLLCEAQLHESYILLEGRKMDKLLNVLVYPLKKFGVDNTFIGKMADGMADICVDAAEDQGDDPDYAKASIYGKKIEKFLEDYKKKISNMSTIRRYTLYLSLSVILISIVVVVNVSADKILNKILGIKLDKTNNTTSGSIRNIIIRNFFVYGLVPGIIEELSKNIALKLDFPWLHTIVFGLYETFGVYKGEGVSLATQRQLLHNGLTAVQKLGDSLGKPKLGFALAVFLHGIFNFTMSTIDVLRALNRRQARG